MIRFQVIVAFFLTGILLTELLVSDSLFPISVKEAALSGVSPSPNNDRPSWWYSRHQKVCEQVRNSNAGLLMIGDSIMQGWEDEGHALWQQFYEKRQAVNLGFDGDRTDHLLWRLENGEVEGIAPKIAVVLIGTNDIAMGRSARHTASGIQAILSALQRRLPDTKIVLLSIFPRSATRYDRLRQTIDATNDLIAHYADSKQVFYLDLTKQFVDEKGYIPKELMPDFVHPSKLGYQIWAETMEETIEKLFY